MKKNFFPKVFLRVGPTADLLVFLTLPMRAQAQECVTSQVLIVRQAHIGLFTMLFTARRKR